MKYIVLRLVIVFGVVGTTMHALTMTNQVQGIYHQKNNEKNCLEIGHMLLIFAREPQGISLAPQRQILSNGMNQLTFTCDNTYAGNDLLKKSNVSVSNMYTIQFEAQDKKLLIVITYDPKKVQVQYAPYTALDMRKGYVIRFFDCTILSHINNRESYILQTAAMGKYNSSPIRLIV